MFAQTPLPVALLAAVLQIILPSSHACKTLNNKYEEVWAARRAAAEARSARPPAATAPGMSVTENTAYSPSDTSTHGSCLSSFTCEEPDADSVVGKPLRELRTAISSKSKQAAGLRPEGSSSAEPALQLHAYSDQVLLVQLEQLTLAAPAAPVLLQQMHAELCAMTDPSGPVTAGVPYWMQDGLLVQQLIDGSNSIVGSSCAPAAASQHSGQTQQAGQAATGAVPAGPQPSGTQQEIVPVQEQQEQQQALQQQRGSPAVPVSMRHGILLLPEDASLALTAAPPMPPLRKVISVAAIKQWFNRQVARVAPRRLVIRPGEAFLLPAERGRAAAAAAGRAGAAAAGAAAAATAAAAAAAHQAAAAGLRPAASDALVLAAYCLIDFQGLELLAGRMQRVQVPLAAAAGGSNGFADAHASVSQQAAAAQAAAGLLESPSAPRASGGSLVGLTHMITRTDVRAAVHEFVRPVSAAGGFATTTGIPTAAAAAVLPAAPTGCNVVALAAADGLDLQLSGWSYQYLMAMIYGNLMHHQNSFVPFKASGPARQQRTAFNPNVKFGPSAGQLPFFALTLSSCAIQVRDV